MRKWMMLLLLTVTAVACAPAPAVPDTDAMSATIAADVAEQVSDRLADEIDAQVAEAVATAVAGNGGSAAGEAAVSPSSAVDAEVTVTVQTAEPTHAINPYIYGLNFAEEELITELDLPVRRWGGNATTRYNWRIDVSNRASDWFFENHPNEVDDVDALPVGSAADRFVAFNQENGTDTLLTVPLIGWTPASREVACGFSVAKYGPQQEVDPYREDCGNGVYEDGSMITDNDPNDISIPIDPTFVQDWLTHLQTQFGPEAVALVNLDNEPMLWHLTHRDVYPEPVSYEAIRDLSIEYAAAVKDVSPETETVGPAVWGWTAYFYSALDSADGGSWWQDPPDRRANDGVPFLEWYLQQMRDYEEENGRRLLDYLDLHYYPQSGPALNNDVSAEMQQIRLRSTRALWDEGYTDESWINEPIYLIPRMHQWVEANYPGTKLAISEYNFGALDHINGALAQADALGIFGRERLDLATLWDPPLPDQPGAYAFRMYRNYDGQGGKFGEMSLTAESSRPDVAVYAARRTADGATTVMLINKSGAATTAGVVLEDSAATTVDLYRYGAADLSQIVEDQEQSVNGGVVTVSLPAESITLLVAGP